MADCCFDDKIFFGLDIKLQPDDKVTLTMINIIYHKRFTDVGTYKDVFLCVSLFFLMHL